MIVVDPIFEQNYRKQVDAVVSHAFDAGKHRGISEVLSIIHFLSEGGKKLVNPQAVHAALQASLQEQQKNEEKVKQPQQQPAEKPKEKPKFEVVK